MLWQSSLRHIATVFRCLAADRLPVESPASAVEVMNMPAYSVLVVSGFLVDLVVLEPCLAVVAY